MTRDAITGRARVLPAFPVRLLEEHVWLALIVWAGYAAFVLVVLLVVASVREIEVSGWDRAVEVVRWFGLGIGVHIGWSVLPLHVTHGQTRREFMAQVVMFVFAFTGVLALMVAVTFVAEAGLYRLAGWPQDIQEFRLYDSALDFHLVVLQHWLVTALWAAGGLFVATWWYRSDGIGGLALVLAIAFGGLAGITFSSDWGPVGYLYEELTGDDRVGALVGVAMHVVLIALTLGLTWLGVRNVPIRNKAA